MYFLIHFFPKLGGSSTSVSSLFFVMNLPPILRLALFLDLDTSGAGVYIFHFVTGGGGQKYKLFVG